MPDPTDPLYEAMDLDTPSREKREIVIPETPDEDAEVARKNTHELIGAVHDAVREMGDIAWTSQSSRAYEVLGQLVEKGLAANRELLEIEKMRRNLAGETGPKTINNTLVLTSTEALELVKKRTKNNEA